MGELEESRVVDSLVASLSSPCARGLQIVTLPYFPKYPSHYRVTYFRNNATHFIIPMQIVDTHAHFALISEGKNRPRHWRTVQSARVGHQSSVGYSSIQFACGPDPLRSSVLPEASRATRISSRHRVMRIAMRTRLSMSWRDFFKRTKAAPPSSPRTTSATWWIRSRSSPSWRSA